MSESPLFSPTPPASADLEYLGFSFFLEVANPTIFPVKIGAGTVVIARVAPMISSPRNKQGQFKTEVDVGRSLAADRRRTAKSTVEKGQGDRGDVTR